jgi:transcriptional antiterminator NusG
MADKSESSEAKWYVVHTYSGYENKVKVNLEKTIENRGLQDKILEIHVPTEEVIEVKNGKRRLKQEKIFHGYVMVKMFMDDETWYVVRNTRGVTGFVGPGSKPIPLTDKEVVSIGMERIPLKINIAVGDSVRIVSGPLENFTGTVEEVQPERQKVRVMVSMFGRDTPVDLDFVQVKKF